MMGWSYGYGGGAKERVRNFCVQPLGKRPVV